MGNPTGLYGAERWILALLRYLSPETVHSYVGVVADDPNVESAELCARAEAMGFETVEFDSPGKVSWSAVDQIRRYVQDRGIDILHTHGYKTDILGLFATRGTRCRNLSTPHGWSVKAGPRLQVYETLDRLAFYFMDRVAPLSPDLYDGLKYWPGLKKKLELIHNGVDLGEIDAAVSADAQDASTQDEFRVGYIGQLISRKRLDTLIRAFDQFRSLNAELILVGEGPQRGELEALAASLPSRDRIRFLGFREDRLSLLKSFAVFVLPSSLEGIPRCLMEAMGAGVAVVSSEIPGSVELVKHEDTGLLFDLDDDGQLAAALERVAGDSVLRESLAESGRQLVRGKYSAESMAVRYTDLYARMLG